MFYEGPKIHLFTIMEAWASRYIACLNATTQWSGVETWATPLTCWTFDSRDYSHAYAGFYATFHGVIR